MPGMQGIQGQRAPRSFPEAGLSAGWMEVPFTEMGSVDAFRQEGQVLRDKVSLYHWHTAVHQVQPGDSNEASMRSEYCS